MNMKLPFSREGMMLHLDDNLDYEILESSIESMPKTGKTEDELVLEAMEHPIGSPKLSELSRGKQKIVIICSAHTRPVPRKAKDLLKHTFSQDFPADAKAFCPVYPVRLQYWETTVPHL